MAIQEDMALDNWDEFKNYSWSDVGNISLQSKEMQNLIYCVIHKIKELEQKKGG